MKTKIRAKLVNVQGDQEEFSDLIGETGTLFLSKGNNWFAAGGDCVELQRKRLTKRENGDIRLSTHLGNRFTFRPMGPWPVERIQ